jgi:hypothetical protein
MKQLIMLQGILLLVVPGYMQAAATQAIESTSQDIIVGSKDDPVQAFEGQHYGNSDFKRHDWGLGGLAICRRRTFTATPYNSVRLSDDAKRLYDYVYTLRQLEYGLLGKQFKDWDLLDIKQVNAWLNRLSEDQPGSLRSHDLPPLKLRTSKKDAKRIDMFLAQPLLMTTSDKKWLATAVHTYPHPVIIGAKLKHMLQTARESLLKVEADERTQKLHAEIHVAAYIHLQIGSLMPWSKRSEETACILGNVILMQHGVKPIIFDDLTAYRSALYKCIQQNDVTPLSAYMHGRIVEAQEQQTAKLLNDIKNGRP